MNEEIPYKCSCGGELKRSKVEVEFFGIHYKSKVQLFPVDKDKLEIKIVS